MNRQWSLVTVLVLAFVSATSAFAQTAAQSDIDQLKAQIELLKQQQAASQQMIQTLENKIDALQKAQPTEALPQAQAAAHQRPAITAPVSERAPALQSRDLFSEDRIAAPRIDNVPLDPDMAGFFRLGDSPTLMRLSGYGKLDVIHDFKLPGNPDLFVPSAFPLQPAPAGNNTSVNFRQSRLDLEIRRPTPIGDLRILYENDFFGAGPTVFHLRHLYGQLDNVLVGYTFTTFMDVDSLPDTLDFENPNSRVYMHQAQFRYTLPLSKANSLTFAAEKPISDINVTNPAYPNIQATPTTPIPDFVVRYRYETGKGHLQLGSVLRSVGGFATPGTEGIFVTKHVD